MIERGGPVMYVILAASVIGVAFALETMFRVRAGAVLPESAVKLLREKQDRSAVGQIIADHPKTALAEILQAGQRWQHGSLEQIQSAIEERVDHFLWLYRKAARPIGILANITPLLGLLGTVIGIIKAFDTVAKEGALGDPGALADGIAQALLTTCFGLIVAIPLLLIYHYLIGVVEQRLRRCEELAKLNLIQPPKAGEENTSAADSPSPGEADTPEDEAPKADPPSTPDAPPSSADT
jgi:biopolymer transport protein ExbB